MTRSLLLCVISLSTLSSCIHAPDVVVIDRKTALEQLAAGSYHALEDELSAAAGTPRPEPLTRAEIEAAGASNALAADESDRTDAAALDELLRRRCVGEALDGSIVVTAPSCQGRVDAAERNRLVERVNRDRFQIWRELQQRGMPKGQERDLAAVRRAWQRTHQRAVVCGGQIQRADSTWEDKKC